MSESNESLKAIIGSVGQLKVLPQVVFQIMSTTSDDQSSGAMLERQISVDPGFTARLLSMANSSYYALPKRVTSIRDAVLLLGFKVIRELAMNASVFDMFVGKTDKESMRRRDWWKHSVDTGVLARWLAEQNGKIDPAEAYTAGLLHFIGKTTMDQFDPAAYERILGVVEKGAPERLAERTLYGVDHIDVGVALAENWKFPETISQALNYEDSPNERFPDTPLRAAVAVATQFARYVADPECDAEERLCQMNWALDALMITADQLPTMLFRASEVTSSRRAA